MEVCSPIDLHKLDKTMRRRLNDLVERVTMRVVVDGDGRDVLASVYLAGLYHGAEVMSRKGKA